MIKAVSAASIGAETSQKLQRCIGGDEGFLLLIFLLVALPRLAGSDDSGGVAGRLGSLNHDIASWRIWSFPGTNDKLLTTYGYGEFYDWDLYFENVYLWYYGVSRSA